MKNFKVGDKVAYTGKASPYLVGKTGVVAAETPAGYLTVVVKLDQDGKLRAIDAQNLSLRPAESELAKAFRAIDNFITESKEFTATDPKVLAVIDYGRATRLESKAKADRAAAKKLLEILGVINDDLLVEGRNVVFESNDLLLVANQAVPAETISVESLRAYMKKEGASEVRIARTIAGASQVRKAAVSYVVEERK